VSVQIRQVHHILIHSEEGVGLRGSREEHVGVATLNRVFEAGRLVVWGAADLLDIAEREGLEKALVQVEHRVLSQPWLVSVVSVRMRVISLGTVLLSVALGAWVLLLLFDVKVSGLGAKDRLLEQAAKGSGRVHS